ncbi:hypothetical protein FHG87_024358 [Trinorchestia longiramus]|nr:hypothetical protein FHG87_024358 [Trinorchestia longiramus]
MSRQDSDMTPLSTPPLFNSVQQPALLYQQPALLYQQPALLYQQPALLYQQPALLYQQPALLYQQPALLYQQPAIVSSQLSPPCCVMHEQAREQKFTRANMDTISLH